jgi:hypothetical protein
MLKEAMKDLLLARISSLSNEVGFVCRRSWYIAAHIYENRDAWSEGSSLVMIKCVLI